MQLVPWILTCTHRAVLHFQPIVFRSGQSIAMKRGLRASGCNWLSHCLTRRKLIFHTALGMLQLRSHLSRSQKIGAILNFSPTSFPLILNEKPSFGWI